MLQFKSLLRYSLFNQIRSICTKPLFNNELLLHYSNRRTTNFIICEPKFKLRSLHTDDNGKISDEELLHTEDSGKKSNDELECIYRFSHIGLVYFAARLKVYLLPLFTITLGCDLLEADEIISTSYSKTLYLWTSLVGLNAILLGWTAYRWIGIIYTDHDMSMVRISYMDALGRRTDRDFVVSDFVPVYKKKRFRDRLFITLKTHKNEKFKLNLISVESANYEKLEAIFGDIPISAFPS